MAVAPDDAPVQRDLGERVVELLVRDDRAPAGGEEGVVRLAEAAEAPDDLLLRRDDQDPVVVSVRDQQVSRKR